MIVQLNIEDKVEYSSIYTSIYRSDELILKYNNAVYAMYESLIKVKNVFDDFNIKDIYLDVSMINIKNDVDKYIILKDAKLNKFSKQHYHDDFIDSDGNLSKTDGLFVKSTIPSLSTMLNNKYHLLFNIKLHYDNYFYFDFDGDTGDVSAGNEVKIKSFTSSNRPYNSDIIGSVVSWKNKNNDTEEHKITWINNDKTSIKFDGDIKDTSDNTQADRTDISEYIIYYSNSNKLAIQG